MSKRETEGYALEVGTQRERTGLARAPQIMKFRQTTKPYSASIRAVKKKNIFPTVESDNLLFDGVPYKNLPICNIRVSPNNTVITLTDDAGNVKLIRSCGIDGFKNTKKGTNIAAQTTAVSLAGKAIDKGYKTVRVRVRGLGPGRLAAVKGLQMGGLDIVSVTDNTHVSWNPPRPRKARRL
ncbi:28S ribosomal protein S11, mitochondrial [Eumeta japonica]|uniref:28S ribosomal protein S11, mitochondrial n=1 Tax=Eumeta variegata TaxID=151549 RepID=A0A4C1W167_EUMVA|nr:28S ribosomal protein S11, mitochondrial [Eumeta japonica]